MLTSKTKYALHALILLAQAERGESVLIADVARRGKIPQNYLERILLELKMRGVLQSRKGKGGGYALRRRPQDIRIGDIVRLMDGPLAQVPCVSQTAYAPCKECVDERTCAIRSVMKDVRDAIANILDGTTLADLVEQADAGQSGLAGPPDYQI